MAHLEKSKRYCLWWLAGSLISLSVWAQTDAARMKWTRLYLKKQGLAYDSLKLSDAQKDSLCQKALEWKKWAWDYPAIMNYLHLQDASSPVAKRTLADLEKNPAKREALLQRAIKYYCVTGG